MARTKALIEAELAAEKERSKTFQQDAVRAEKAYERTVEENNQLRNKLMEATTIIAKWEGYFNGIESTKPPKVSTVEQPGESTRPSGVEALIDYAEPGYNTYSSVRQASRQWWHR